MCFDLEIGMPVWMPVNLTVDTIIVDDTVVVDVLLLPPPVARPGRVVKLAP
jgi:hypothetical protein